MRNPVVIFSTCAVMLFWSSALFGVDRLVPSEYATIQAAIDAAVDGDNVVVADGTYTGDGNRDLDFVGKAITVQSENGPAGCTIDCQSLGRGLYFHTGEDENSVLLGFTITNGMADSFGGAIFCDYSSPSIANCIFRENTSGWNGGAIHSAGSSPRLITCIFERNTAQWGGGLNTGGVYGASQGPIMLNCTFVENYASNTSGGGGVYCSSTGKTTLTNCLLWGNTYSGPPGEMGQVKLPHPVVNYCCIEGLTGGLGGVGNIGDDPCLAADGYHLEPPSPCINAGDPCGNYDGQRDIDGQRRVIGVCVDIGADEFDIEEPVIYIWPAELEFLAVSWGANPESQILLVRNAGTGVLNWQFTEDCDWLEVVPSSGDSWGEDDEVTVSVDIAGLAEGIYNCELTISDANALNSPQTTNVRLIVSEGPMIELSTSSISFYAGRSGTDPDGQILTIRNSGGSTLNWEIIDDCGWLSAEPNNGSSTGEVNSVTVSADVSGLGEGTYNCELTVSGAGAENSPQVVRVRLLVGALLVPIEYATIQAAIDAAVLGDTVIIAPGTYSGAGNKELDFGGKVITVQSTNPDDPAVVAGAVIDCEGSGRGFCFSSGETLASVVAGLTITNGNADMGGGIFCVDSSPTITKCVLSGNTALWYGGGIVNVNCSPKVSKCIFNGNNSNSGGGMDNYFSSPMVSNCIFSGNSADYGSGISSQDSSPTIIGCTFSGNHAELCGGGMNNFGSNSTLVNCIVWGNTAPTGAQIMDDLVSSSTVSYSDVEGGWAGPGNIDSNPLLISGPEGDYYLSQVAAGQAVDSPCVDAGSDTAANLGMGECTTRTDEVGEAGTVDMGYHYGECDYALPEDADINGDYIVDLTDFSIVALPWLVLPCAEPGDIWPFGGDGIIDIDDLRWLTKNWLNCVVRQAEAVHPSDAAEKNGLEVTLEWLPGDGALYHDVYLGTDANIVAQAGPGSDEFMGTVTQTSLGPFSINLGTQYYWRVDEAGGRCTVAGDLWSFQVSDTFVNSIGMSFVELEPGSFRMGSTVGDFDELPLHQVTISQGFYMSKFEVTNAQYEQFDPNHALTDHRGFSHEPNEAVIFVSWEDANAFCDWLSQREGLPYRLPTEAEWGYACRAGTTTKYYTGSTLPAEYHKNQVETEGPVPVPLYVGETPANAWGLCDMHGNVEEWCYDWYGPYDANDQNDPVGRADGDFKVSRGGSHSTTVDYLRSANRMGTLPEDKHWLIGFRVVLGDLPVTAPLPEPGPEQYQRDVNQAVPPDINQGPDPDVSYFDGPRTYVKIPQGSTGPLFARHNHDPALTNCPNGDLLAIWYTCVREKGRELAIAVSRLRYGQDVWEWASPFWDAPDRNDHAPAMWTDETGKIYHFNGLGEAATWASLATVLRTSSDNGVTWSRASLIMAEHGVRHMPVESVFRARDSSIILPCDAVEGADPRGTAIWLSDDNGLTWWDPGGTIAGIHAGVVQLDSDDLLAFGREDPINGMMPKSLSENMGQSWAYSASEFPIIDSGQRLVLRRLKEGPILFVSFTGSEGMMIDGQLVYGMFAAISYDEGQTWPVKRLVTPGGPPTEYNGGGNTGTFIMDDTHAEPRGYLASTQTPDGVIHIISSALHYRFNLAWVEE